MSPVKSISPYRQAEGTGDVKSSKPRIAITMSPATFAAIRDGAVRRGVTFAQEARRLLDRVIAAEQAHG